ncbi:MAG: outer membrane beta-barrel protein [Pseudomonadota bacterium]|nr:outer membrane beta-barrel protein [Pseudomonadota bacterium]
MPALGTLVRALLIPLGGLTVATACADETGSRWSFGTQLGQVRGRDTPVQSMPQTSNELSTLSYDVAATFGDKNRVGWRVFTGYRFSDALAIHVGYTDLGKAHSRLVNEVPENFGEPVRPEGRGTQTIRGMDVGLQLKMPLSERVAVELRGGKYFWKSSSRVSAPWAEEVRSTQSDSDNFLGAGVEVGVIDDLSATLGWTRYEVAGERIAMWTVGVLYGFSYF